jgi:hypothetical protein
VSSGVFLDWIDVFSGDMEVNEYLFENKIRSRPLLCGVYFSIFIGVLLIYLIFINNIFAA